MIAPVMNLKEEKLNFPTKWQAVIFRNYGFVSDEKIAKVLDCSIDCIKLEAKKLGLEDIEYNKSWEEKGYLTIIRNNWNILNYEQLCIIMGYTREKLEYILEKEDFFWVKLGFYKPFCKEVKYTPLTSDEEERTKEIYKLVSKFKTNKDYKPFDFFSNLNDDNKIISTNGMRIIHGYLSPCGDTFMLDSRSYLNDELLNEYAKKGVNGIWLHGVLSQLSPYVFDECLSIGYEQRRKNLLDLVNRCKQYGIKVYLYLNEPRGLPIEKFSKFPHLKGRVENEMAGFCIEQKEVQKALYYSVKSLFSHIKDLGGIISITMSENLTHCNYRPDTNCECCKNIPMEESASKVNNIMMRAIRDSGSKAELIANLWGWSSFMGWSEEQTLRGIDLLDKDISILSVSEYDLEIEKGGINSRIIDYSLSNPGPSEITKKTLIYAREKGHKIYAKIQINNSWEMSVVPYLPMYDLMYEHLYNLNKIGVNNLMLTWTLGGYPSPMIDLVSSYENDPNNFNIDSWYNKIYGINSEKVHNAVIKFCEGFREYPFSIDSLYYSPKTLGVSNLWNMEDMGRKSAMVSFAYDDYENWIKPYPINIYINQYKKLLNLFEEGIKIIDDLKDENVINLKRYIKVAYNHFYNDLLQTQFSYYKRYKGKYKKEIKEVIEKDKQLTKELINLMCQDPTIGYEASNHYFYTERNLLEKLINLNDL